MRLRTRRRRGSGMEVLRRDSWSRDLEKTEGHVKTERQTEVTQPQTM